jgi:hypothetical protein
MSEPGKLRLDEAAATIERLTRELNSCATARDEAGFIGSVPDCIEALDGETKLLASRAEAAESELAKARARNTLLQTILDVHADVLARAALAPAKPEGESK